MAPTSSILWRNLRVHQIYGANTDVGKTVFTTILCNAVAKRYKRDQTFFLKPVSTGLAQESDSWSLLSAISEHIARRAEHGPGWLFLETAGGVHSPGPSGTTQADLYTPLRAPVVLVGDAKLGGISQTIAAFEALKIRGHDIEAVLLFRDLEYKNYVYLRDYFQTRGHVPVETVSPPPAQCEDDSSETASMLSYYDSASSEDGMAGILHALDQRAKDRIARLDSMRDKASNTIWYPFTQQKLLTPDRISVIDSAHGDYFQVLDSESQSSSNRPLLKPAFDGSASWWTQGLGHANPQLTLAAAYAAGRYGHVMFAEAIHEPALALAELLLKELGNPRLSRVFYSDNGSTGCEVAVKMGLRAARTRYGWAPGERLEILGLKGSYHGDTMGAMDCSQPCAFNEKVEWYDGKGFWFDYPTVQCTNGKWTVAVPDALRNDLGDSTQFASLSSVFDLDSRTRDGQFEGYKRYISETLEQLHDQGRRFGALMLEPVVLGAGGMLLVDPLFQRALVEVVRASSHLFETTAPSSPPTSDEHASSWSGLPVIFDEVFTGLYRLGRFSAASLLGVNPDISVHAKLLTGGLVPLCATVASEPIFAAFASDDKSDALLHGHSYTAHAVGCQVALESLSEMQSLDARGAWDWAKANGWSAAQTPPDTTMTAASVINSSSSGDSSDVNYSKGLVWSIWSRDFVENVSQKMDKVSGVWALGSVLAISMRDEKGSGYKSNAAVSLRTALHKGAGSWNAHTRVLGNVFYVMGGQKTDKETVEELQALILDFLDS
ncbi:uncharacterized protein E0L32_003978 [Thyridium curvatum]|uniref:Dethiobiotin synthase n=1 Tax=Thyridium curvatum TaxID=1093900 RepID=A0A507BG92_9PEZI|nr:uncharacterized protein E0L32_003978 [Thyridium curvatum]TPX16329.1 hypothetical protein E0L32_003978 [Thyridium curvatum]